MTLHSEPLIVSSGKRELLLNPPIMNAAGFLGFPGRTSPSQEACYRLGAQISPPISLQARSPAADAGSRRFPGGFLLHSGHPNPGLDRVLRRYGPRWAARNPPVLVHVLGGQAQDTEQALLLLEQDERIAGVEIGLEHAAPTEVERAASLAAGSELPAIVRLPLDSEPEAFHIAEAVGAPGLSFGPPRGRLPGATSAAISGRIYGPALFPLALAKVETLAGALRVPLIAAGGVYAEDDLRALLQAGAAGVQLDGALWTRPKRLLDAVLGEDTNP